VETFFHAVENFFHGVDNFFHAVEKRGQKFPCRGSGAKEEEMKRTMVLAGWALAALATASWGGAGRVLCTTFPICQIVRNVAEGREGTSVELLLPSSLGCPHNYSLTPQDMRKLAEADVLVANGLGMEEFLGAPVERANARLRVVDSSADIGDLIPWEGGNAHAECGAHGHEHGHGHRPANPHLFASPRMSAKIALNVAGELSKIDPAGAATYFRNAAAYGERMEALASALAEVGRSAENPRIVQPFGAFDYFARDAGLEIVASMQPHGQEPSAAEMIALVETVKAKRVGYLFAEPQYSDKVARTISRETGVPVVSIDPGASGPDDAPLDYFDEIMRQNVRALGGGR
jgi:zinc transport system substrate-binding protein